MPEGANGLMCDKPMIWTASSTKIPINLSDQSSLSTYKKLRSLSLHCAYSDKTGWIPRLIRDFAGCKAQMDGLVMQQVK